MQSASRFGSFKKYRFTFLLVHKYCDVGKPSVPHRPGAKDEASCSEPFSCWLQRVQLEDVVIGRRGEEQLLLVAGTVVTRALQAQCPLKVQELPHEVEVWGNVGLLPLDKVIRVVEREVESLHQVGHGDRDWAADASQAVDQDAALLRSSLICRMERKINSAQSESYLSKWARTCCSAVEPFNGKRLNNQNLLTKVELNSDNYLAGSTGADKLQATDIRKTTWDVASDLRSNVSQWKRHFLAQKTSKPAVN